MLDAEPADVERSMRSINWEAPNRACYAPALTLLFAMSSTVPRGYLLLWLATLWTWEALLIPIRRALRADPAARGWFLALAGHVVIASILWSTMPVIIALREDTAAANFIAVQLVYGAYISIWSCTLGLPAIRYAASVPAVAPLVVSTACAIFGSRFQLAALAVALSEILLFYAFNALLGERLYAERRERLLSAELEQRRRQAEADAALRAEYLAHMSHEIRAPLSTLALLVGSLPGLHGDPDSQHRLADRISTGAETLLSLLNTVLDYSQLEAGKLRLVPRPVDIGACIARIIDFHRMAAEAAGCRVVLTLDPNLPRALRVDCERFGQVLSNLITNAIRCARGATIMVTATAGHGQVHVRIADTGPGVPVNMRDRLFQPFENDDAGAKAGGAGLGLAIARGLIELMDGTIGFEPTAGGGATFWFVLPDRGDMMVASGKPALVAFG